MLVQNLMFHPVKLILLKLEHLHHHQVLSSYSGNIELLLILQPQAQTDMTGYSIKSAEQFSEVVKKAERYQLKTFQHSPQEKLTLKQAFQMLSTQALNLRQNPELATSHFRDLLKLNHWSKDFIYRLGDVYNILVKIDRKISGRVGAYLKNICSCWI